MSTFLTEGLIKEVAIQDGTKVTFKLEPVAPYIFENKKDDGSTERCLLFVNDDKNPSAAKIITAGYEFVAPKPADFHSLIIAKANRMRVKILVDFPDDMKNLNSPVTVLLIVVL